MKGEEREHRGKERKGQEREHRGKERKESIEERRGKRASHVGWAPADDTSEELHRLVA
jgi:hypothetical protein